MALGDESRCSAAHVKLRHTAASSISFTGCGRHGAARSPARAHEREPPFEVWVITAPGSMARWASVRLRTDLALRNSHVPHTVETDAVRGLGGLGLQLAIAGASDRYCLRGRVI